MFNVLTLYLYKFLNIIRIVNRNIIKVPFWVTCIDIEQFTIRDQLSDFIDESSSELNDLHAVVAVASVFYIRRFVS